MISKNKIKEIRSLERKKIRSAEGLFVAEGPKVVGDLMQKYLPQMFVHTPQWKAPSGMCDDIVVTEEELQRVSFLQHPQQVLAVFHIQKYIPPKKGRKHIPQMNFHWLWTVYRILAT